MTTIDFLGSLYKLLDLSVIVLQFVYVIFAFIVIRQVSLMNKTFRTPIAPLFTAFAFLHFVAAVVLVFISLVVA